jgi:hypothetical protein
MNDSSMEVDLQNLTDTYLRHGRFHREDDFWAWEEVHRIIETNPDKGWRATLLLLDKAESDTEVGVIAAGPLEDLIDFHGHKAFDRIEPECEHNARLRLALSTVGVLFYYDEFDRWYALLCRYGFKQAPAREDRAVIEEVMHLMKCYLDETMGVGYCGRAMVDMLDFEPLKDKRAQKILQRAYLDFERLDSECRPPYKFTESELRTRLGELVAELESLGYRANTSSVQDHKI